MGLCITWKKFLLTSKFPHWVSIFQEFAEQWCPKEFFVMMKSFYMWLLSTWNEASATEEEHFKQLFLILINLNSHMWLAAYHIR